MFSVIFDMDGTLLDTQSICIPAWEYAGNLQHIPGMGSAIAKVCGMNENGWTRYLEDKYPSLDIPLFKVTMRKYIIDNLKVRYKKGAAELIDFLKSKGIRLALASGTSRPSIDHHLKEVGAQDLFEVIVGGKDVENGKPHPDVFILTAQKMGVDPKDCYVFEDSANGVRAAYAAGMKPIGIPDVAPFTDDIKKLMYTELTSLDEAIDMFGKILLEQDSI